MFCSLYEITKHGQIAKQAFAKIPNSMILSQEATREKVKCQTKECERLEKS